MVPLTKLLNALKVSGICYFVVLKIGFIMYILIQKDLLAAVYIFGGQNFGYKIGETSSQDHSKCKVFYEIKKC